jgi:hypothetical protein
VSYAPVEAPREASSGTLRAQHPCFQRVIASPELKNNVLVRICDVSLTLRQAARPSSRDLPVINLPAFLYQSWATGKKLPVLIAAATGIPERSVRAGGAQLIARVAGTHASSRDLSAVDFPGERDSDWFWGACYSTIVSHARAPNLDYRATLALARRLDGISRQLFVAAEEDRQQDVADLLAELGSDYFEDSAEEPRPSSQRSDGHYVQAATHASDLRQALATATNNAIFSVLAQWDLEFAHQFEPFAGFRARPVFAYLLPKLDPAAGHLRAGTLSQRRDMFWLPVRRLLSLLCMLGHYAERGTWLEDAVSVGLLVRRTGEPQQNLINWRDGTKRLKESDFFRIWQRLHKRCRLPCPLPLFVAATFWQNALVSIDRRKRGKKILFFDDHYHAWWVRHRAAMAQAHPLAEDPWPRCFDQV